MLKDVSLGAMSIFTWLLAVLATAMLLPKDIEDRTLYTILAKPVPRFEYLLGKLLGVLALLFVALVADERASSSSCSTSREQSGARRGRAHTCRRTSSPPRSQRDPRVHLQQRTCFPGIVDHLSEGRALRRAHAAALDLRLVVDLHDHRLGGRLSHRPRAADRPRVLARRSASGRSPLTKIFLALIALVFPGSPALQSGGRHRRRECRRRSMLFLKTAALGVRLHHASICSSAYFMFSRDKEL